MVDQTYICGAPTRDGSPCQHRVSHPDVRCRDHPRTVFETGFDPEAFELEQPEPDLEPGELGDDWLDVSDDDRSTGSGHQDSIPAGNT